jgi:hypothetical protein
MRLPSRMEFSERTRPSLDWSSDADASFILVARPGRKERGVLHCIEIIHRRSNPPARTASGTRPALFDQLRMTRICGARAPCDDSSFSASARTLFARHGDGVPQPSPDYSVALIMVPLRHNCRSPDLRRSEGRGTLKGVPSTEFWNESPNAFALAFD